MFVLCVFKVQQGRNTGSDAPGAPFVQKRFEKKGKKEPCWRLGVKLLLFDVNRKLWGYLSRDGCLVTLNIEVRFWAG